VIKLELNTLLNMENKDFAVFILTHGRPDNVLTYKTLLKCGYKGKVYFVIDNEDKCIEQYQKNFGAENVMVFDKKAMADKTDEANNFDNRKVIVHARNYCFELAEQLGYKYFIQLDDDYYEFIYKFSDTKGQVLSKDINKIFDLMFAFYKSTSALSICFAQTGDFIGGVDNGKGVYRFAKRKCMNSFFCSTERPFRFVGSINEDVNTYTTLAGMGGLFLTIPVFAINQKDSQTQKSGMSDIYKLQGTYIKSFTTVLMQPSNVSISMMNASHKRIHHSIKWINTTPMIISEKYKKFNH
jgi:hypothetical protein